jgi:hypothetical protein
VGDQRRSCRGQISIAWSKRIVVALTRSALREQHEERGQPASEHRSIARGHPGALSIEQRGENWIVDNSRAHVLVENVDARSIARIRRRIARLVRAFA